MTPQHNNKSHSLPRYIFVTGGVVSSLGKGVSSGVIIALLEGRNYSVSPMKMDPYLNIDPGTMNPYQHGEVYVTDDGFETDLDIGHYERFGRRHVVGAYSVTSGQVYYEVLTAERRGDYAGATVQVIPHVTDEIKRRIREPANTTNITLVEVGGTVGDIESQPFLEAIRQMRLESGLHMIHIHVTLVPSLGTVGEIKTKPTQHSVRELRAAGLQPDLLLCRTDTPLSEEICKKISLFCSVPTESVFAVPNVNDIYQLPLMMHRQNLDKKLCDLLDLDLAPSDLSCWERYEANLTEVKHKVNIALVGKYVSLVDSYKSLNQALTHAGFAHYADVTLGFVDAETLSPSNITEKLQDYQAIVIPGGFGKRGIEGMILTAQYCRENSVPLLGICLGLHIMVIESARNLLGLTNAHTTEIDQNTADPVVSLATEWTDSTGKVQKRGVESDRGGTMRLGKQPTFLEPNTIIANAYQRLEIGERHRHRYEINPSYLKQLQSVGWILSGHGKNKLVEVMEYRDHPWLLGCQFHPELTSTPTDSHPLFSHLMQKVLKIQQDSEADNSTSKAG